MAIHILIDGYNLIRQSDTFRQAERHGDLEHGRDVLINALARYRRVRPHPITVVFDGADGLGFGNKKEQRQGINVIFSSVGESADSVIKKMVRREGEKLMIVTSDRDIVSFAAKWGATTIDSVSFEQKMQLAQNSDMHADLYMDSLEEEPDQLGWVPTTSKKGPSRRLSKRDRKARVKKSRL